MSLGYRRTMGRAPRVEVPGGIYHVTARGNNRGDLVWDDYDRDACTLMLGRAAEKYEWVVLAYCLMTNHYHLLVRVPRGGLSAGIRLLNGGYSRRTNVRYGRVGHLFQNRFGAVHVTRDEHLKEASRYIVLNPVRAGLCAAPAHWRWSSYRAAVGLEFPLPFLACDELLGLFGRSPAAARSAYGAFVLDGLVPVSDTVLEL